MWPVGADRWAAQSYSHRALQQPGPQQPQGAWLCVGTQQLIPAFVSLSSWRHTPVPTANPSVETCPPCLADTCVLFQPHSYSAVVKPCIGEPWTRSLLAWPQQHRRAGVGWGSPQRPRRAMRSFVVFHCVFFVLRYHCYTITCATLGY